MNRPQQPGEPETGIHARMLSALQWPGTDEAGDRAREPCPVLSSESCSGCSGLDNGRALETVQALTVAGALEAVQASTMAGSS